MVNIQMQPGDYQKMQQGDMNTLLRILETERDKAVKGCIANAEFHNFRFNQGIVQTLEAVIKILPQ